jgi:hypothetical protein
LSKGLNSLWCKETLFKLLIFNSRRLPGEQSPPGKTTMNLVAIG